MSAQLAYQPPAGRVGPPSGQRPDLDADLRAAVRRTARVRQGFYLVVLAVALTGQVRGATRELHIPLLWALPAVAALELGGIVVLANADLRRRLGERAIAARALSALLSAWAVGFNWLAHPDHLQGGFFAGMSALGYLVWLTHTENQRRDRLRATGDLPPTTPAYQMIEHWLRHPWLTLRAKSLAKQNPQLGLYRSLAAARDQIRQERRRHVIATVLHRKIRAAVDPSTADIAVAVYDLDQIAARLAERADYDTLTTLINADLTPARLTATVHGPNELREPSLPIDQATTLTRADPSPDRAPGGAGTHERDSLDVPTGACTVSPAGTSPLPPGDSPPAPAYEPTSDEDAAMYRAWRRGVATGQEPSGPDLARAAGRHNDATGVGRRAARRYRDAHVKAGRDGARQASGEHPGTAPATAPDSPARETDAAPVPSRHNGHNPTNAPATTRTPATRGRSEG